MRLQPEQTKRIMECIAKEMGVELGDTVTMGDGVGVVVDSGGFKSPDGMILHAGIMQDIIRGSVAFERCPWEPRAGDAYFFPAPNADATGVKQFCWVDTPLDNFIKLRVGVYRTKEEAIQKARELGWVE